MVHISTKNTFPKELAMLGGINSNYNISLQTSAQTSASGGQNAKPTFAHGHTWSSLGEMENAWRQHTQDWASYYSTSFSGSGAEGDGKITLDELNELLEAEFSGMGVKFTDSEVDTNNPKMGKFEVYIDQTNRQKMASDPEYRAKVMGVIQSELAGSNGYSVQMPSGTVNDRTTGLSMNIAGNTATYEGVPHSAGGTGSGQMMMVTSGGDSGESKSILEQILERLEKKQEEKKEKERIEAAKQARQDLLEISVEAKAKVQTATAEKIGEAEESDATIPDPDDEEKSGGLLNVLA